MFRGSFVALATPFSRGRIDEQALKQLVNWHIEQGTDGIVAIGKTAESSTLNFSELKQVLSIVVQEVAGRVPVVAAPEFEFSRFAEEIGVDAVLYRQGYDSRPGAESPFRRFKALHDSTNTRFILDAARPHTVSGPQQFFSVDISARVVSSLSNLPRVVGIHDGLSGVTRIRRWRQSTPADFSCLSGAETEISECDEIVGDGTISVLANIVPSLCSGIQAARRKGDDAALQGYQERVVTLGKAFAEVDLVSGIKYALSLYGLASDECRSPRYPISPKKGYGIRQALLSAGVL